MQDQQAIINKPLLKASIARLNQQEQVKQITKDGL
jgi:hypothetical protein